jgi:hypothetical protein
MLYMVVFIKAYVNRYTPSSLLAPAWSIAELKMFWFWHFTRFNGIIVYVN